MIIWNDNQNFPLYLSSGVASRPLFGFVERSKASLIFFFVMNFFYISFTFGKSFFFALRFKTSTRMFLVSPFSFPVAQSVLSICRNSIKWSLIL